MNFWANPIVWYILVTTHGLVLLEDKIQRKKWLKIRLREEEQRTND